MFYSLLCLSARTPLRFPFSKTYDRLSIALNYGENSTTHGTILRIFAGFVFLRCQIKRPWSKAQAVFLDFITLGKMKRLVFMNRRRGMDRRFSSDLSHCDNGPLSRPPSRSRRQSKDRRDASRSLSDDYYAYMQKTIESMQSRLQSKRKTPKN